MKPKPFSAQHRFILLAASLFALMVWFLAGAIYLNLKIRDETAGPVRDLQAALKLHTEIQDTLEELILAARRTDFPPGEHPSTEFQAAARKLPELTERYSRMSLPEEERRALGGIRRLQSRFIERASQPRRADQDAQEHIRQVRELRSIERQVKVILGNLAQAHHQRLQTSTARLQEYSRSLYLLLSATVLYATLAVLQFRRFHRQELWEPLEDLRRMVAEIRRGNLNLTGRVPDSIELGSLVKGFLEMAGELRQMRDSLELKVRERTAKLEATQRELVQAAKLSALGQLVSGVAHEINNPLTSILGFSELVLARPDLDARARTHLQTIREEAIRLRNLVANLSAFARRGPQRTARVDLRQVLDRLVDLRRYQLQASNIELHYDRPASPVWVEGDSDQLVQVFFNLVLNSEQAINSCRSRGDIWLACGAEAGRVWATVRDNGAGISPAVLDCIFDPFFTTKPVGQGAGLGLSISHGIIQQHRGAIAAESVEGQGTTMRISLPTAPPKDAVTEPAPESSGDVLAGQTGAARALRALIIDDEPAITELLEQFLGSRGWGCVVLKDSTALEASLAGQHFDLVICDLKMPGRNGLEVLRRLREHRPELARRFLLMTGNLADAEERGTPELAGVPILRKPFTLARLAEALRALLSDQS